MNRIVAGVLDVAYSEAGPRDGLPVVLLHGFPYDIHAYDAVADRLAAKGLRCVIPFLRGFGPTRFLSSDVPRSGQQAALAADLLALMDALNIPRAILAGYDWGGRAACIVAALWPDRVRGLVSCDKGYNIQDIAGAGEPAAPEAEHRLWYQHYFQGERARSALETDRRGFCRYLWKLWSPSWNFDDATFEQSAEAFDNPDFVDVVLQSYRHRFGNVAGDPSLQNIERQLAAKPVIGVRTIVLQGADDGVNPPKAIDDSLFPRGCARSVIASAGHNVPQEKPGAFADAVLSLA